MPGGTFEDKQGRELEWQAHSWKREGEDQPQRFDLYAKNLPEMDKLLVEITLPDGKTTGAWVDGPFEDWESVDDVLGSVYNSEGSR